jgi:hypothetical protein
MLIDPSKSYETNTDFSEPIPEGDYNAEIAACEYFPKKPGGKAPYYKVRLKIVDDEQEGRTLFDYMSLSEHRFCKKILKDMMVAVGINTPMDLAEESDKFCLLLTNKKIRLTIEHEEDGRDGHEGEYRARARDFRKCDDNSNDVIHTVIEEEDEEDIPW